MLPFNFAENRRRKSKVFRGDQKGTLGRKGLNCLENKQKYQSSRWWTFIFTVCVKYDLIYNNEPKKLLC